MRSRCEPRTTQELLLAAGECVDYGARFVSRTEVATFHSYAEIIERAKGTAAYFQQHGVAPGDRIAIILPTSIHFLDTYLGAILAGAIPAALYPPFRLGRLDEYYARTANMLVKIGARLLVTDRLVGKLLGPVVVRTPTLREALRVEDINLEGAWTPVTGQPGNPAFLQFSSGSTQEPKAITVTHRNLVCNLEMMAGAMSSIPDPHPEDGAVCWLPLYHDMGLVGCMFNGLNYPATVTYLRPDDFIVKPALWLRTLSRYRSQVSPAPHFAYRLCAAKVKDSEMEGVDLSSWRMALNGAEPIDVEGMRLFQDRFARWGFCPEAMTPAYGLAEAGLAVSFSSIEEPPLVAEFDRTALALEGHAVAGEGRRLTSVGKPLPGMQVEIRDEEDRPLEEGRAGRIMARGDSISPGYWQDPENTAASFRDGWLDTGDLGFLYQSNLYIVGRAKDMIIVRGRNYAPQEIEELISAAPGVRTGCVVAVGHCVEGAGEELIVFAEKPAGESMSDNQIAAGLRDRIVAGVSLNPYLVQIVEPGTLSRTSSGKLRRSDTLRMFLAGELVPPDKVSSLMMLKELGKSQLAWGRFHTRARG